MKLYSTKQRWKISLFMVAVVIATGSLWYSNTIVDNIRTEERNKVKIWSVAIKKNANLVFLTNQLFNQIRNEDILKTQFLAAAYQFMNSTYDSEIEYNLLLEIIKSNKTIPLILTDSQGNHQSEANLPFTIESIRDTLLKIMPPDPDPVVLDSLCRLAFADSIRDQIKTMKAFADPTPIYDGFGATYLLHFNESILLRSLKYRRDSLINAFNEEVINNTTSVPVVLLNENKDRIITSSIPGIESGELKDRHKKYIDAIENEPIEIVLDNNRRNFVYYEESAVITRLRYYPLFQIIIVGLFLFIAYLLFNTFRRAEQNQVWVGLAKETAHQLGTPLSSLMAWVDLLEIKGVDQETLQELNKDVQRLETITDRFSKIGSETELTPQSVASTVQGVVDYLKPRISKKITLTVERGADPIVPLNKPLFEWVIENLCKNAIDAMKGNGQITIRFTEQSHQIHIDVTDTGAGIPSSKFKTVFQPGYTTKKRGWGLGLSLVKRIVENYHHGKIFVRSSVPNLGTTFRITLKKSD